MSAETQPQTPSPQDTNLVEIRKALDLANKNRVAAEQKVAQLEAERQKRPQTNDEDDYSDEPYVDHKVLNKKFAKFEETFEKKVDQVAEQKARMMIEQERQSSFLKQNPDFEQILSPENLKKFVEKHPEMAEPMLDMPDNFSRQKLLYQNIKALGVNKPAIPEVSIQQKIDANRRSPYYQPSGGNTPPYGNNGDFSESGKKNAYEKMKSLIANKRG